MTGVTFVAYIRDVQCTDFGLGIGWFEDTMFFMAGCADRRFGISSFKFVEVAGIARARYPPRYPSDSPSVTDSRARREGARSAAAARGEEPPQPREGLANPRLADEVGAPTFSPWFDTYPQARATTSGASASTRWARSGSSSARSTAV